MKSCATCIYWVATEMEVVSASHQPHQQDTRAQTEMLRATHALCTGPINTAAMPPWAAKRVGGGELTNETDGADCPVYKRN